ncbi:MAG: iron donor protein CyaY [Alphaproteobacteria bacterium]|nr:iron donor protein CyaY [Alphaproteobacteria bacterium]
MSLDESRFAALAAQLLSRLSDLAEEAGLDADLQGNVLTLELEDGRQFVINSHAPLRQIWLSSPVSGASHYEAVAEGVAWRSTRGGADFFETLSADIKKATGLPVAF